MSEEPLVSVGIAFCLCFPLAGLGYINPFAPLITSKDTRNYVYILIMLHALSSLIVTRFTVLSMDGPYLISGVYQLQTSIAVINPYPGPRDGAAKQPIR